MNKKYDLPAMPFYVGDWLKCPEVRALSLQARAVWFDMLCFMWESTERGCLSINGKPIPKSSLARMLGIAEDLLEVLLNELESFGVYSLKEDGTIFNRKMVKTEEIRVKRAIAGRKGGICSSKRSTKIQPKVNQITENEIENETENEILITRYAENVNMTVSEYERLVHKHGKFYAEKAIYALDNYKGATGKEYENDYKAILSWVMDKVKKEFPNPQHQDGEKEEKTNREGLKQIDSLTKGLLSNE